MSETPDDLLTVTEAASLLRCCTRSLYRRIRDGSLPHRWLGCRLRLRRGDVLGCVVERGNSRPATQRMGVRRRRERTAAILADWLG